MAGVSWGPSPTINFKIQLCWGWGWGCIRKRLEMKIKKPRQSVPYMGQGLLSVRRALLDPHDGKSLLGGEAESLLTLGGSWGWLCHPGLEAGRRAPVPPSL